MADIAAVMLAVVDCCLCYLPIELHVQTCNYSGTTRNGNIRPIRQKIREPAPCRAVPLSQRTPASQHGSIMTSAESFSPCPKPPNEPENTSRPYVVMISRILLAYNHCAKSQTASSRPNLLSRNPMTSSSLPAFQALILFASPRASNAQPICTSRSCP